jgi:ABC-type multidrug transport system ATPase subunit
LPATDAAVRLQGVAKRFGSRTLFENLSFAIKSGELFVMTGPSGSGKTTLLRMIAGLMPFEGTIQVHGDPVVSGRPTQDLVLIPQQPSLWEHLTALENVALVRRLLFREQRADSRRSAMSYLAKVDVAEAANRYPRALSGGESQRVGLARGLATERETFLLDEITANIDYARKDIVADLVKVLSAAGKTIVMVTHDPEIVRLLGVEPYELRPGGHPRADAEGR